jgi:hypothetical protein
MVARRNSAGTDEPGRRPPSGGRMRPCGGCGVLCSGARVRTGIRACPCRAGGARNAEHGAGGRWGGASLARELSSAPARFRCCAFWCLPACWPGGAPGACWPGGAPGACWPGVGRGPPRPGAGSSCCRLAGAGGRVAGGARTTTRGGARGHGGRAAARFGGRLSPEDPERPPGAPHVRVPSPRRGGFALSTKYSRK